MRKKQIILSVTNDLETDQRVHKVATFFYDKGFDVLVIGRKLKNSQNLSRLYRTKRFNLFFNKSVLFYTEYTIRLFVFLLFSKYSSVFV